MRTTIPTTYILGAGRSGTTALTILLGNHREVQALGEMHQFFMYLQDDRPCACGARLGKCPFWQPVLRQLPEDLTIRTKALQESTHQLEYHTAIPTHWLRMHDKSRLTEYHRCQTAIFKACRTQSRKKVMLDSAKYIGRFLALTQNNQLDVKGIYMVRDVRGVIHSFAKKVQTSRSPLSTILYYLAVNAVAQWVYWWNASRMIKVRYEDFLRDEASVIDKICTHLDISPEELIRKVKDGEPFDTGHLIGGNRMKANKQVQMRFQESWKASMPRAKQVMYYLLALPFMLLNGYRV